MRKSIVKAVCMLVAMLLVMTAVCSAMAEETVNFMHILNCGGTAEIIGAADQVRTAAADEALASGEKVRTGEGGITKISLAEAVFVTLDANTEAVFAQEQGSTAVELIEGALFLDVQRELGDNEKLEIKVGSFTVNVPGCMVFAFNSPVDAGKTRIGVLEDKVTVGVPDASGMLQEIHLSAGQMISSLSAADAQSGGAEYAVAPATPADLQGFVEGLIANDSGLMNRVIGGAGADLLAENDDQQEVDFSDKNWTWTDKITLIAQSASKYYDGTPLAYPSNVLVFGLPDSFSIEVSATGSLTNAGTADNVVGEYKIYNSDKEDVTSHFVNVEKIKGELVVKPAPLTVWTGSAEKTYDGKPLTNSKATVKTVAWYSSASDPLRNSAVSVETETGENALVAASGRIA
ncbi:MAG: FecR domain-containing protein, partial [Clostridia bacterium]|nr:FecR domain-containing protein [Clostridia bacterium]